MTVVAVALLVGLLASNVAWLIHDDRLHRLHRDQTSELVTRIQHPAIVNPRSLEELPPPPDNAAVEADQAELERVGTTFLDGVPDAERPAAQ